MKCGNFLANLHDFSEGIGKSVKSSVGKKRSSLLHSIVIEPLNSLLYETMINKS
jgi:hypothetical protein